MDAGMSDYGNGVYRDGALYVIALKGGFRKRYSRETVGFQAPYRTFLGGKSLDLMVAVELPPQAKRGTGFEVTVNPRLASDAVLEELLLLEWYVDRDTGRLDKRQVGQPLGVWTYEGGFSLVACVSSGPTRPLEEWLRLSKGAEDLGLAARLAAQAHVPTIQSFGSEWQVEGRAGRTPKRWAPVNRRAPLTKRYLFRNTYKDTPGGSTASSSDSSMIGVGGSSDEAVRATKRLPGDLKRACKKMDFRELRQFIDDCLRGSGSDKEAGGPDVGARCPRSEEESLALVGLLREKAARPDLPELVPEPGPAPPSPPFEPSEELRALREEQGQLDTALQSALRDPEATTRSIKNLRRKLGISASKANNLEATETAEHEKRRDTHLRYRKALSAHKHSVRERKDILRRHHKLRGRREEIVARVERDVRRAFKAGSVGRSGVGLQSARRLPWLLLPPGELSVERLRSHYAALAQRDPDFRYEPERIEKAFLLEPEECYVGTNEFDGYVVFTFAETDRVLLECPVYGNAVYVLGHDWRRLSKLSKGELLSGRPGGVTKIVHKGDWFARVITALGLRQWRR